MGSCGIPAYSLNLACAWISNACKSCTVVSQEISRASSYQRERAVRPPSYRVKIVSSRHDTGRRYLCKGGTVPFDEDRAVADDESVRPIRLPRDQAQGSRDRLADEGQGSVLKLVDLTRERGYQGVLGLGLDLDRNNRGMG